MKLFTEEQPLSAGKQIFLGLESFETAAVDELQQTMGESFTEIGVQIDDTDRLIETVVAIESLIEAKKNGATGVALEGYAHVANMAVVGTGVRGSVLINPSLSLEALASHRNTILAKIGHGLSSIGKSLADNMQYSFSILEFQSGRLRGLKQELQKAGDETKTVKLRDSKYLRYDHGKKVVQSGQEYVKEYKLTADTLGTLAEGLTNMGADTVFSAFKNVGTIFNSEKREELIEKQIGNLIKATETVAKISKATKEDENPRFTTMGTPVMLGLVQIEIMVPETNDDFHAMNIHVERIDKFEAPSFMKDHVELQMSKKEVEELLKANEHFLYYLNEMQKVHNNATSIYVFEQQLLGLTIVGPFLLAFTKFAKVHLHALRVLSNSVAALYNVSFGNVKQSLTLAEKFLK